MASYSQGGLREATYSAARHAVTDKGGLPRMCVTRSRQESVPVSRPQQPCRLERARALPVGRMCMRLTSGLERCAWLVPGHARCPGNLRRGERIPTLRNGVGGDRARGACIRTVRRKGGYR